MPITQQPVLVSPETLERYCRFRRPNFKRLVAREQRNVRRYNDRLDRLDIRQARSDDPGAYAETIQAGIAQLSKAKIHLAHNMRLHKQSQTWLPPERELEIICTMPTVYDVNVTESAMLEVSIHGTVEIYGTLYSTGDWLLEVGLRDYSELHVKELRSPIRDEFLGLVGVSHGVYRISRTFCFGKRYNDVNDHIRNGSLIAGLGLAIDSINFINEDDLEQAAKCLKRRDNDA